MLQTIAILFFTLALLYAGTRDLMSYEIPNWVSLAMIAAFLVTAFAGPFPLVDIGWHLAAGAAVLAVGFILFAIKVFGGGDAKLLAACAVWVGWAGLLEFFMFVALIGGVFALALIVFRRLILPESWTKKPWIQKLHDQEGGIPYGVAIGLGGILMVPELPLYDHAIQSESTVIQGIQPFMA
jgi:prepilin peptidase CpaA